jgi:hypothetical protein
VISGVVTVSVPEEANSVPALLISAVADVQVVGDAEARAGAFDVDVAGAARTEADVAIVGGDRRVVEDRQLGGYRINDGELARQRQVAAGADHRHDAGTAGEHADIHLAGGDSAARGDIQRTSGAIANRKHAGDLPTNLALQTPGLNPRCRAEEWLSGAA